MSKRTPAVEVHNKLVTGHGAGLLFDTRPIEVDGYRLLGRSITPVGRPSIRDFQNALALACEFHESSPYWIGGLCSYAESREDWNEKLDQAMSVTKLARRTLQNLGHIYRNTNETTRALAPTPAHAAEVIALPETEQVELLSQARSEELTVRELRLEVRTRKRRKVLEGRAVLEGLYRVWYIDPPWLYGDREPSGTGAESHYPGMTIEALCKMPIAAHSTPDAAMGMWTTAPILLQNPGPRDVLDAWGFVPKTQIIWDKVEHNYGNYVSVRHEILIIATRGSCTPDRPTPMFDSVVVERRSPVHSEKPATFRKMLERLWDGPYIEVFGRAQVEGWTVFGNDPRLWSTNADEYGRPERKQA